MPIAIKITWGGWAYTRQQIDEDVSGQCHRDLEKAHLSQHSTPLCTCTTQGVAMHVARHAGRYIIKRMPNSGHLHAAHCESFSGLPSYAKDIYDHLAVRQKNAAAPVHIALTVPLTTLNHAPAHPANLSLLSSPKNQNHKHTSMTLRGYLHLLWESAGLNVYLPDIDNRRNYTQVSARMEQVAEDQFVLGGRQQMSERIYVPSVAPAQAYRQDAAGKKLLEQHYQAQISQLEDKFAAARDMCQSNEDPIVLMLGELMSVRRQEAADGAPPPAFLQLKSSGVHHEVRDYQGIVAALEKNYPGKIAQMLSPGYRDEERENLHLWMLLGVQLKTHENTGRKYLRLAYGNCLLCSDKHIPVESSYELAVAKLLQHERRHFVKPLRYESDKAARPDFVLLDTRPNIPMEVFGFSGEKYEARKLQKIQHARYRPSRKLTPSN
jgi:Protein of unknown function (DUF1173)